MSDDRLVTLTFGPADAALDEEDRSAIAALLLQEAGDIAAFASLEAAREPEPEAGGKAAFAVLTGMLTATVSAENLKKLLGWLGDRLGNQTFVIEVQTGDLSAKIQAKSKEELDVAEVKAFEMLQKLEDHRKRQIEPIQPDQDK